MKNAYTRKKCMKIEFVNNSGKKYKRETNRITEVLNSIPKKFSFRDGDKTVFYISATLFQSIATYAEKEKSITEEWVERLFVNYRANRVWAFSGIPCIDGNIKNIYLSIGSYYRILPNEIAGFEFTILHEVAHHYFKQIGLYKATDMDEIMADEYATGMFLIYLMNGGKTIAPIGELWKHRIDMAKKMNINEKNALSIGKKLNTGG